MMTRASRSCAAVLFAAVLTVGCDQGARQSAQSTADDALIAAQVRAKATAVDAASLSLVHVTCDRGAVVLTGTVATPQERDAIEKGARSVDGVRSVDDRLVIDRSAPTAAQIEADLGLAAKVHAALAAQTGVNAARIHVDVHRGVVTLTGTLPTPAHREVADETARGVHGVVKLIDEITVTKQ
jgi:hyperosmotically inducible periplasmic protein